ncbi:hypothetical protein V5098_16195, partial [Vibrio coralliirubri]|uniref:hypothetical protein n=1 Tax=Vibrio coralliirubri TaxID=1516159 RepID=UPI002FD5987B
IGISNKWDELASLRNTINKRERELRKRALNYELDPLKVLEARQDITMWITKGESSNRMIQMDINNKKTIRLKAWLSIDQNNLNTHQQYDRQPIEKALIDSLFTEENECLNNQLEKVENAMKTLSQLSKGIDNLKSTIKSSGLA